MLTNSTSGVFVDNQIQQIPFPIGLLQLVANILTAHFSIGIFLIRRNLTMQYMANNHIILCECMKGTYIIHECRLMYEGHIYEVGA